MRGNTLWRYGSVVPLALAVLLGCSQSPIGSRYRAERALWRAQRLEAALRGGGNAPPAPAEIERVLDVYAKLLAENPVPAGADTADAYAVGRLRAQAELGQVRIYRLRGDTTGTRTTLDHARTEYPWDVGITLRFTLELIDELTARGDADGAARLYQQIASDLPARLPDGRPVVPVQDAPIRAADIFFRLGRQDEAMAELDRADLYYRDVIAKNPQDPASTLAWIELGSVESRRGNYDKAAQTLEQARRSAGATEMQPRILFLMGTLQQEGRHDMAAAEAAFSELAERYPDDPLVPESMIRRAAALGDLGRTADALAVLDRLDTAFPRDRTSRPKGRLLAAEILTRAGRWPEALSRYRSLQADFPTSPEAMGAPLTIAAHYRGSGEKVAAQSTLERALEEYGRIQSERPGTPVARMADEMQVRVLMALERWSEAADKMLAMSNANPADPRTPFLLVNAAGVIKDRLRDSGRAAQILERVAADYPNSPLAAQATQEAARLRGD